MIVVRVFGGLGNQMFQYSFYKAISKNNKEIYLDISDFSIHKHHYGFELEKVFNVKFDKASKNNINKLSCDNKKVLFRVIKKLTNIDIIKNTEVIDKGNIFKVNTDNIMPDTYFNGFWQNKEYVVKSGDELINEFQFKEPIESKNLDILNNYIDKETVAVHIRRGDYVNNLSLGGVCDIEYYKKAIQIVKQKIKKPIFLFFSDDMIWVKNNIKVNDECVFVDWNTDENSYRDMQLMSLCKHNIIANSTFSWWGAWLNKNKNKIIIAPEKWFTNKDESIILESWIKV